MLLGFRTGVLWKKILSVLYLMICGLLIITLLLEEKYVNLPQYDFNINRLTDLVIILLFVSPYIFLSKTPFREKLPLFKAYNVVKTSIGLVIVFIILSMLIYIVDECHSPEYKADMKNHNYLINENVEPTCEVDGNIRYKCDFCGASKSEAVPLLGHDLKETKNTDASCQDVGLIVEKCNRCDYLNEKETAALGHNFVEVSRKEATCEEAGAIVEKCNRCDYLNEKETAALGHNFAEVSRKEPTCEEPGLVRKQCDRCKSEVDEEIKPLEQHDLKEISKTDATCQKNGIIKYGCINCNYTEEKSIEKTTHEMEVLEDSDNQTIKKCKYCDKEEIIEKSQPQTSESTNVKWDKDISKIMGLSISEAEALIKMEFRNAGVEQDGRTHYVAEHSWNGTIVAYTDSTTHKIDEVCTYTSDYNIFGVTIKDKANEVQEVLNSKGWYLIQDSETIYRKGNSYDGIFISNQYIKYAQNCLKPYLLKIDTLNAYSQVLDTTEGSCYIGNGQVLEYAYESIKDFMSYYADETDIRKKQIEDYYKGLYLKIEGEVMDIYADGSMWIDLQGTVGQGVVEIVPQQYNWLNELEKGDSVVVFAKLKGFTLYTMEAYDGILFQYNPATSKMKSFTTISIPLITSVDEGIYIPLGDKVYDYFN